MKNVVITFNDKQSFEKFCSELNFIKVKEYGIDEKKFTVTIFPESHHSSVVCSVELFLQCNE